MRHPGRLDGTYRPTIGDVAAKARVSTATVSRALRFPEQVTAALRERVGRAVAETGYVVNVSARALATLRTGVVGIVTADLAPHAALVAAAIGRLATFGLTARVAVCGADADGAVAAMIDADVEAVILIDALVAVERLKVLATRKIVCVEVGAARGAGRAGVYFDVHAAAVTVSGLLYEVGHRSAVLVASDNGARIQVEWLAAVRSALPLAGMTVTDCDSVATAVALVERMMAAKPRVAVLCASDLVALGAMSALRRAGISVPAQASCVGWGDEPFAALPSIGLASMRIFHDQAGAAAADAVLAARSNGSANATAIVPKLVMRESVCFT